MKKYIIPSILVLGFLLTSCGINVPESVELALADLGSNVRIHTEAQNAFAISEYPDSYVSQNKYDLGTYSNSAPLSVEFTWSTISDNNAKPGRYEVYVSKDSEFTASEIIKTRLENAEIFNLEINTFYYWKVVAYYGSTPFTSNTASFKTQNEGPRNIRVPGVENVRDLGGWALENGQTYNQGLIYRSSELNGDEDGLSKPTKEGKSTLLNQLKIKSEIDLRKTLAANGQDEVYGITSSPLGSSVAYKSFPMVFGGNNVITYPNNNNSLKAFFAFLAVKDNYPIIFHCVRGTDRTGALAYALGALCGMNGTDLVRDYLFSNFANINSAAIRESNINGTAFYQYGINQSEGSTMREKATNYLINHVGVTQETLNSILAILVS